MAHIIKVYRQSVEAMRFIGKQYLNKDRGPSGFFDMQWNEWNEKGWFPLIEKQVNGSLKDLFEDGGAPIGLMREEDEDFDNFEYWIGCLTPEDTPVPDGFLHIDFPKSELGVCWIYGKEDEVFGLEGECGVRLEKEGFEIVTDWCMERYARPRFTTPDANGNIIFDICFFIK